MGHTTNTPQKNPPSYRTSYATLNEEIISTTPHPAKTKHEKPRKLAGKQANYDSLLRLSRHKHQQKMLANVYPSRLLLLLLRHKSSNTRYLSQQQRCFRSRNPKNRNPEQNLRKGSRHGKTQKKRKNVTTFVTCHEP